MKLENFIQKNHKDGNVLLIHDDKSDRDGDPLLASVPEQTLSTFLENGWVKVAPSFVPPEAEKEEGNDAEKEAKKLEKAAKKAEKEAARV